MWSRALLAGVLGAVVISAVSAIARGVGVPLDLEYVLGSSIVREEMAAYMIGLVMWCALGGVLGLCYAAILRGAEGAGAFTGATIGLVHALVVGVLLALLPVFHPAIPEQIAQPGMLMIERGIAASLLFIVGHVMFGALMGLVVAPATAPLAQQETT
jgi:hypothetical protein